MRSIRRPSRTCASRRRAHTGRDRTHQCDADVTDLPPCPFPLRRNNPDAGRASGRPCVISYAGNFWSSTAAISLRRRPHRRCPVHAHPARQGSVDAGRGFTELPVAVASLPAAASFHGSEGCTPPSSSILGRTLKRLRMVSTPRTGTSVPIAW